MSEILMPTQEAFQAPEIERKQPWRSRIEKIRENGQRNLTEALEFWILPKEQSPTEAELEQIRSSLGVTVNLGRREFRQFLIEGNYRSREEKTPKWKRLFDSYLSMRRKVEKRLGIRPTLRPEDPPLIYGGAISNQETDQKRGGAPMFGDVILILNNERIRDRVTFSYGDSFGANAVVSWEEAPLLKYWREKKGKDYVEAQITGGLSLADVKEVRFALRQDNPAAFQQYEQLMDSPEMAECRTKYPELKLSSVII